MSARLTVEELARFLKEDPVVAQTGQAAAAAANVGQASDDLVVVEEEDVARLANLELDDPSELRATFQRVGPAVARLLASWRTDSDSAITLQELLWALTYIVAAQQGDSAERIQALVVNERWWQRISEGHQRRFLDRTVSELAAAEEPRHEV